jgi:N-acetylglutamate synthase-like GNAT family acetyltransferase
MHASPEIHIRPASPADAAAIAQVLYESFVEYEDLYTPEGFSATALNTTQILIRMQEGPVWVAYRGEIVLGTVAAVMKGNSVYMRGMAVIPVARGSRVGARLLECVEHWARRALGIDPTMRPHIPEYHSFSACGDSALRKFRVPSNRWKTTRSLQDAAIHDGKRPYPRFALVPPRRRASIPQELHWNEIFPATKP